ncbi:D-alanine--D-alanine ligase family protein [Kineococcus terrestris]|uniref:D-alanine--D-alanine ligase family protein n=1 Tax=Kineococcus terrestris TaxID=2044856 RepID=UPI0034DB22F9
MTPSGPSAKPRVAVLFGGRSSEHAISCVTAASVLAAVDRARYDVVPVGITRGGQWVLVDDDPERLRIVDGKLPEVPAAGERVALAQDVEARALHRLDAPAARATPADLAVDVVFPLLHGPYGEDGTLQGLLEMSGTRYVGSGVLASAAGMDKQAMKTMLAGAGLSVGPWWWGTARRWETDREACRAEVAALGLPVFVKPARAGSSIGISRVDEPGQLDAAVAAALEHDPKFLVEARVAGREVEVGVLQEPDGTVSASLPGEVEVVDGRAFYDFEAKYLDAAAVRISCPADLPAHVTDAVRRTAVEVFAAMGAEGLARVDLFVDVDPDGDPDGGGGARVVVNEINTMPGFTPTSMFPQLWAASGVSYEELVDRLLQQALHRPAGLR